MQSASGGLRGADHVGFTVSDLERSIAWYTVLLERGPVARNRAVDEYIGEVVGYPGCELVWALWTLPGGLALELIEYVTPAAATVDMETFNVGNGHLCLACDDIDAVCRRLRGQAEFRSPEPVRITSGPCAGERACYLRDPDGITVELTEPTRAVVGQSRAG